MQLVNIAIKDFLQLFSLLKINYFVEIARDFHG